MKIQFILILLVNVYVGYSQVGIGTTVVDESAILDIPSNSLGVLLPEVTNLEQNSITLPAHSLLVFNTDSNTINFNSGTAVLPKWEALNPNTTVTSYLGQSAKYSNTDITSNLNTSAESSIPLFGQENWNDNSSLYINRGNTLVVTEDGRYEITANIAIASGTTSGRKAPEVYISVNGTQIGSFATTGYMRRANGHESTSLHCNEILELRANDTITITTILTANNGTVTMRSLGSSDFYIEKKS